MPSRTPLLHLGTSRYVGVYTVYISVAITIDNVQPFIHAPLPSNMVDISRLDEWDLRWRNRVEKLNSDPRFQMFEVNQAFL